MIVVTYPVGAEQERQSQELIQFCMMMARMRRFWFLRRVITDHGLNAWLARRLTEAGIRYEVRP